jgi:3',5'-cyclic-AMP phosphodiesterase
VLASGMVDKIYNLWNRNPVTVRSSYLLSSGAKDRPPTTTLSSY